MLRYEFERKALDKFFFPFPETCDIPKSQNVLPQQIGDHYQVKSSVLMLVTSGVAIRNLSLCVYFRLKAIHHLDVAFPNCLTTLSLK